jgi:hypothetical protein
MVTDSVCSTILARPGRLEARPPDPPCGPGPFAWVTLAVGPLLLLVVSAPEPAEAQNPCTTRATERPTEVGCYFTAAESLGVLRTHQRFRHLYPYPSRAAAERARQSQGVVVEVFDKVWLYTIAPKD